MHLLDTHALLWTTEDMPQLGPATRRLIDDAFAQDGLATASFSFWEIAMLVTKRRLSLRVSPLDYRNRALALGLEEIPLDGKIAVTAATLDGPANDPADRIIAATALACDATLITADERLLGWRGPLKSHDARR